MATFNIDIYASNIAQLTTTRQAIAAMLNTELVKLRFDESRRHTGIVRLTTELSHSQRQNIINLPGVQTVLPVQ